MHLDEWEEKCAKKLLRPKESLNKNGVMEWIKREPQTIKTLQSLALEKEKIA